MFSEMDIKYIKWYHKLFLWILPKKTVSDYADHKKHVMIYKECFGKIYILSVKNI